MAALLVCAGCTPLNRSVDEAQLLRTGRYDLIVEIDAPKVRGLNGCGAQALAAALAHEDPQLSASEIASQMPWQNVGATPVDLLLEARRRGFSATVERGSIARLSEAVQAQDAALVMFDGGPKVRSIFSLFGLPPKVMHWSMVSGMARDGSQVLLAARGRRHYIAKREDFLTRWEKSDFCMIVVTRRSEEQAVDSGPPSPTTLSRLARNR